jgi:hypothetical protein
MAEYVLRLLVNSTVIIGFGAIGAIGRRESWFGHNVLASGPAGAEGGGLDGRCGLVVLVGLLDEKSDTTLLSGDDANSLLNSINIFSFVYPHMRAVCPWFVVIVPCSRSSPRSKRN